MYIIRNGQIIRDDGTYISKDEEHPDHQAYLKWVKQGNSPTQESETTIPTGNNTIDPWNNLAIAFHRSHLYSVRLREATSGAPSELCDQLWWLAQDLTTVVVNWVGDEEFRVKRLNQCFLTLFDTLEQAGFPASEEDRNEINKALVDNEFEPLPS